MKVDQSFVGDVPDEPDAVAIVSAVIAMGHALKLKIIAEGVETRGQMDFLQAMGCDIAQGYYLGHAMPHEEFVRLLQNGIQLESRQKTPLTSDSIATSLLQ